ncbi:membrane-spanning 4-domains subfamily A member 12-like isoform X2 [Haliaeetus albicilla]|uniref:membrane-spanning 4-domains subfamily A member 12-like isoform X2 n=1 Tax=Haliaeetus albicilla TaxID=8969 RepID=UPI0037E85BC4
MQGMGSLRLGSRAVMYTAETLPKGKNRVMGTIQIMTGFMHIGFGIVLTTLTNVYTSVFVIGEIPFLGGVSFIISGCLSIGAEKSPTECAVKGSQTMNIISAIFALLGIIAFIVDLNLNGLYRSSFNYYNYLVLADTLGDDSHPRSTRFSPQAIKVARRRAPSETLASGELGLQCLGEWDFCCAAHLHHPGVLHRCGHCQFLVPGHPSQF